MLIIQETQDGSHTLYSEEFDEIYHSRRGAWQESMHVFVEAGLNHIVSQRTSFNILEIGFGTGLNAILTVRAVGNLQIKIQYTGIEPLPVPLEVIEQLNYLEIFEDEKLKNTFLQIHESQWNQFMDISENLKLQKVHAKLTDFESKEKFDLVYFDAFAPSKQPEMWTKECFEKIASLLNPDAILVTYCSKGEVQRNLKAVGFQIEKLAGPIGKREMIRATYKI